MRISCKTVSSRACGNRSLVRANGLAGSRGAALRIARQAADTRARRIIRAVREQSQIEAMREALRGDRERAEARRKAGRPGAPRVPPTRHDPPAAQVEAPAAPPGLTDTPE
jgi:hypothetical protein